MGWDVLKRKPPQREKTTDVIETIECCGNLLIYFFFRIFVGYRDFDNVILILQVMRLPLFLEQLLFLNSFHCLDETASLVKGNGYNTFYFNPMPPSLTISQGVE